MRQRSISVVFTGQIRDKELFEKSLDSLAGLGCVKEIILSTWHGDAISNIDYLKSLETKYGLSVVTSTDPNLEFDRFNGFRQSITMRRGLDAVRNPGYVLKTRTDCYIDPDAIRHLSEKDLAITDHNALGLRIFREKISVTACSILAPFYIDDKLIFGHHGDLLKLCSTDFADFRYPSSGKFGHYIRFYPAFMADFPMFLHFIKNEIYLTTSNEEVRRSLLPLLVTKREFLLNLLVYYRIVSDFFCMDWGGHAATFKGELPVYFDGAGEAALSVDDLCASNEFFRNASHGCLQNAEIGGALNEVANSIRHVSDIRDIGCGIDFAKFWADVAAEAKRHLQLDAHIGTAKRMMLDGQLPEAFRLLGSLLPADVRNTELRYLMGLCCYSSGQIEKAIVFMKTCLDLGASYDSPAGQMLLTLERESVQQSSQ